MRTGCPKAPLVLTDPERHTREDLARRARTVPQVVRRAALRSGTICAHIHQHDGAAGGRRYGP